MGHNRKKRALIKRKQISISKTPSSEELISFIQKVMELRPIEFVGLLKIMCVEYWEKDMNGKVAARELDTLLSEIIDQYVKMPRHPRKELHNLVNLTLESYRDEEKNGDGGMNEELAPGDSRSPEGEI